MPRIAVRRSQPHLRKNSHIRRKSVVRSRSRRESAMRSRGRRKSVARSRGRRKSVARSRGRRKSVARSRGRRKSVARSRGRRKSVARSRGRRTTNKAVTTRIGERRNYSNPPGTRSGASARPPMGEMEAVGSGGARPRSVEGAESRSQKMPKKEAQANSWEGYVDLIDTRIDEPLVLPAAADPRVAVFDMVGAAFLRDIMRDEFFNNHQLAKYGQRYGKLRIDGSVRTAQILEPLNTATFSTPTDGNSFVNVNAIPPGPADAGKAYLVFKNIRLLTEFDGESFPPIAYETYPDLDHYTLPEIFGLIMYGPGGRQGHIHWDGRALAAEEANDYDHLSKDGDFDRYRAQCPKVTIATDVVRDYITGERARYNVPYGAGDVPCRAAMPGIRTIIMGKRELEGHTGQEFVSKLDGLAEKKGVETFYVLYVPSNYEKGPTVNCIIVWSAEAAQDFIANMLCPPRDPRTARSEGRDEWDGAYVPRDSYCIFDPAVVAIGDDESAHWAGMVYPKIDSPFQGLVVRQGYSCSYRTLPGLSCQLNNANGLCMLNALIFALGYEHIFVSARNVVAESGEGDVLDTVTLGFHRNVLTALYFVMYLMVENQKRFNILGHYAPERVIPRAAFDHSGVLLPQSLEILEQPLTYTEPNLDGGLHPHKEDVFSLLSTTDKGLPTEDHSITLQNMLKYMLCEQNKPEFNFWTEHFKQLPDGRIVPIQYELDDPDALPSAELRLEETNIL